MVKRTMGKRKLTPQVRQRLAEMADEVRHLVYGEAAQSVGAEERTIENRVRCGELG